MSRQYDITGIGPVNTDGSQKIFTILPKPFIVTAAWLGEQSKAPAIGDVLEENDAGALTLVTETQAAEDEAEQAPNADGTQKKSLGAESSSSGSEPSPFKQYQAKPLIVSAAEITDVGEPKSDGGTVVTFADGSTKRGTRYMTKPQVGDAWVIATVKGAPHEEIVPKEDFSYFFEPVGA